MKRGMLFLALTGLIAFEACKKDDNNSGPSSGPTAKARFVNAVLNADSLRVKINDTMQSGIPALTYLTGSTYQNVRAGGSVKSTFYFTTTGATLVETTQAMTTGSNYSYFAAGNVISPFVVFTMDNLAAPTAGKAKVRFANLSPDNMIVDCYVGTPKVVAALPYKSVSDFNEVDPGSNLTVMMNNKDTITLKGELGAQNIIAGKIYTYMLTGTRNGSGAAALKLTAITNN